MDCELTWGRAMELHSGPGQARGAVGWSPLLVLLEFQWVVAKQFILKQMWWPLGTH